MFCFGYAQKFPANAELARKVRDYLDKPLAGMFEVGDGLLAVRQVRGGSFDLFFDEKKWLLADSIVLKEDFFENIFPFELTDIGVLSGKYFKAGIRNTDIMFAICEHNLIPKSERSTLMESRNRAFYDAYGFLEFPFKNLK